MDNLGNHEKRSGCGLHTLLSFCGFKCQAREPNCRTSPVADPPGIHAFPATSDIIEESETHHERDSEVGVGPMRWLRMFNFPRGKRDTVTRNWRTYSVERNIHIDERDHAFEIERRRISISIGEDHTRPVSPVPWEPFPGTGIGEVRIEEVNRYSQLLEFDTSMHPFTLETHNRLYGSRRGISNEAHGEMFRNIEAWAQGVESELNSNEEPDDGAKKAGESGDTT
ncbi:hypothetical protein K439DRAFT_1611839 [Ramaria rubella]|nr:hypothetical protein K439DRAFT_1611839 [Ramaria rubella]